MRIGPLPSTTVDSPGSGDGLVLLLVGRVEVRRGRVELGRAGIDHLVDRPHARVAGATPAPAPRSRSASWPIISSLNPICFASSSRSRVQRLREQPALHRHDALQPFQEPRVHASFGRDLVGRHVAPERRPSAPTAACRSPVRSIALASRQAASSQSSVRRPNSSERTALFRAPSKVRSMAITSPVAFICVPSARSPSANLSKGQRGILTTQ